MHTHYRNGTWTQSLLNASNEMSEIKCKNVQAFVSLRCYTLLTKLQYFQRNIAIWRRFDTSLSLSRYLFNIELPGCTHLCILIVSELGGVEMWPRRFGFVFFSLSSGKPHSTCVNECKIERDTSDEVNWIHYILHVVSHFTFASLLEYTTHFLTMLRKQE